jgi:hypothetical protein
MAIPWPPYLVGRSLFHAYEPPRLAVLTASD